MSLSTPGDSPKSHTAAKVTLVTSTGATLSVELTEVEAVEVGMLLNRILREGEA